MRIRGILSAVAAVGAGALFAAAVKPDLPPPFATPSVRNNPRVIPKPAEAKLDVPAGFHMEVWAEGFQVPRFMALGPGNEVLLSDSAGGTGGAVYAIRGKERKKVVEGLNKPYGLALWNGYLYVAEPESVKRYRYDSKTMNAAAGKRWFP